MRMILCVACAKRMKEGNVVERAGANSKRDKCACCGQKIWCGAYDVTARTELHGVGRA